jgi:hypothetical protein
MTDSHPAMNSIRETKAWSTSGYLIFLTFLALLALTIYRIIAFAAKSWASLSRPGLAHWRWWCCPAAST